MNLKLEYGQDSMCEDWRISWLVLGCFQEVTSISFTNYSRWSKSLALRNELHEEWWRYEMEISCGQSKLRLPTLVQVEYSTLKVLT